MYNLDLDLEVEFYLMFNMYLHFTFSESDGVVNRRLATRDRPTATESTGRQI